MRLSYSCCALFCLTVAVQTAAAQQQFAIPTTVRAILQSRPTTARLVLVRGYLSTIGNDAVLRDENTGHKIDLDFSHSSVPLEALPSPGAKVPVEVTGRVVASEKTSRLTLAVVGTTSLTP